MYVPEYSMKDLLDDYNAKARAIICKAIEKNILVTDTSCNLLGVNVYNAVFHENHIISRFFVMFGSDTNPQIEYGDFVIETNDYKKITKIYRV